MNLIEADLKETEEKGKKLKNIIIVAMVITTIIIFVIMGYIAYLKKSILKVSIDGQADTKLQQLLVFEEDGTIYAPIKEVAALFGYESFNGDYTEKSEDPSKCYVQSQGEVANFALGSNKIYKLDLANEANGNYENVKIGKEVKAINGVLYVTTEGLEKAFNLSFNYNKADNTIDIYTMPYLIQFYTSKVLDYGYKDISNVFANQKTVLQNMLVVSKETGGFGVIDVNGNVIIEPKYDNITYLPEAGEFLVQSKDKVGIITKERETKIPINYTSIKSMGSESGLYLVGKDNKFGVFDANGNIKIYIENDEIGIDIARYTENNIKNKYILPNNLIPVRKDKLWGLYDTKGNLVVDFMYDRFGYEASNGRNIYSLLMIPEYNVLVACRDKKYTLLDENGKELMIAIADDIYMTISSGETHYYINANNKQIDAEGYLKSLGIISGKDAEQEKESSKDDDKNNTSNKTDEKDENKDKTTNGTDENKDKTTNNTNENKNEDVKDSNSEENANNEKEENSEENSREDGDTAKEDGTETEEKEDASNGENETEENN